MFRSYAFFRNAVADGAAIVVNGPSFVATGVTEMHFELISDNGAAVAVVNQFDRTGSFTGAPEAATSVLTISFHRPSNGTTASAHTTKVYAGGRDISTDEAAATAIPGLTACASASGTPI